MSVRNLVAPENRIGGSLKRKRKASGYTQAQLVAILQTEYLIRITVDEYSVMENNKRLATPGIINALVRIYNTTYEDLMTVDD